MVSTNPIAYRKEMQPMKRFIIALVCIVMIALIIIAVQHQYGSPTFFQSVGGGDLNSLERRLGYIQSKLGIESHEFEFATPPDRKLIATFVAKLNGEIVPDLSHVFYIPPSDKSEGGGRLSIYFLHNSLYQTNQQDSIWEFHFHTPTGGGYNFTTSSPFDPSLNRATTTSTSRVSSIRDDEDYEVWDYQSYPEPPDEAMGSRYAFSYWLSIRMEKPKEGEKIERISRAAFAAAN